MWQRRTVELAVWSCKQNNAKKLWSICASILSLFINLKKRVWMNTKSLKHVPFYSVLLFYFLLRFTFLYYNYRRNNTNRWLADPVVTRTITSVSTDFPRPLMFKLKTLKLSETSRVIVQNKTWRIHLRQVRRERMSLIAFSQAEMPALLLNYERNCMKTQPKVNLVY